MEFYSLNDVAFDLGVFDSKGFPVDLGNLAFLSADILDCPQAGDILATSTLPASDLHTLISLQNWNADLDQNASISFGIAQLQGLSFVEEPGLAPKNSRWFWMVIHGITVAGEDIVYGAGWVRIYNVGVNTLNLPLYPVPIVIPAGCTYTIPAGVTITTATPIQNFGSLVFGQDPNGVLPPGRLIVT